MQPEENKNNYIDQEESLQEHQKHKEVDVLKRRARALNEISEVLGERINEETIS